MTLWVISGAMAANFLGYRLLKTFQSLEPMLIYLGFEVAPEKKSHGVITTCPGNISLRIPSERRDVDCA
jgi:hypothetical protein